MGYIARTENVDDRVLRQAVIYGSTFASFVVENFSLERIRDISKDEIHQRIAEIHSMTSFARPWEG